MSPIAVASCRHRQALRLLEGERAALALRVCPFLHLAYLALHVVPAKANLALQAAPAAHLVAADALVVFAVQVRAGGLVLVLIVVTQPLVARSTPEQLSTVLPSGPPALHTHHTQASRGCIFAHEAGAGMHLQALAAVAHPCLAEVAHRTHHGHASGEAGMLDEALSPR